MSSWRNIRRRSAPVRVVETSDEEYGEEIIPRIDQTAFSQLTPDQQLGVKKVYKETGDRVRAKWRKQGKAIPEADNSSSSKSSPVLPEEQSAPPQIPELQMDSRYLLASGTRTTFGASATENSSERNEDARGRVSSLSGSGARSTVKPPARIRGKASYSTLGADASSNWLKYMNSNNEDDGERSNNPQYSYSSAERNRDDNQDRRGRSTVIRIARTRDQETQTTLPQSNEFGSWEGRSGTQLRVPIDRYQTSTPLSSSGSHPSNGEGGVGPVEARAIKRLRRDNNFLSILSNERSRDYARSQGIGPVLPAMALRSNQPSSTERVHATTITRVHNIINETGSINANGKISLVSYNQCGSQLMF